LNLELATDGQREGVLVHLRELFARGEIEGDLFDVLTSVAGDAVSVADLADVMSKVPPLLAMTAPDRRLTAPLELRTMTGSLKMNGRWQVGQTTNAMVATGSMLIDLTQAQLDDDEIDLSVKVVTGSARVVIPYGMDVQIVELSGGVRNKLGSSVAPPTAPLVRISAVVITGSITLCRPKLPRRRRWRRRSDG
jgi:hypothetical protein